MPLGIDIFEKLRTSGCYYVDKSGFIKELLEETFEVNLITRPRRFGKTLAMSMLAEFFDIRKENRRLFDGLEIFEDKALCELWMNQWPVLFISFKDVQGNTFEDAIGLLAFVISSLCVEHAYLEHSEKVDTADKSMFLRMKNRQCDETDIKTALYVLMRMMSVHYGKNVILLVDEYDVPLAKATDYGYYDDMLNIIRSLLGMAWKTNPFLKFAVVTGCLRIAKESIFTGANNFISNSISGQRYDRYFGFTETEIKNLLIKTGLLEHFQEIRQWYDGYLFGTQEIYCPWDVINHVSLLQMDSETKPANYWRDTSHNSIIRKFIDKPEINVNEKFELLLAGSTVQEHIVEDLTYDIANSTEENLWSILYLTGYLTRAMADTPTQTLYTEESKTVLRIPNEEVKSIFAETIAKWFADTVKVMDRKELFQAWWSGDDGKLTQMVTDILFDTISYFDYKEDYYHAFMAGLFSGAGYEVLSNKEQGTGRADVIVKDRKNRRVIIIEAKHSKKEADMKKDCIGALKQIKLQQYFRTFLKGYKSILCYGAAFFEKECLILLEAGTAAVIEETPFNF